MDSRSNFDQVINRRKTNSSKWDMMDERFENHQMIHLGVADMDFKAPPAIIHRLRENIEHGIFGYSEISERFYQAIIKWIKRRTNQTIPKEWIVYSIRVKTSVSLCVELFTKVGDEIILHSPFYNPLYQSIVQNNRIFIESPLKLVEGRYEIDFRQLESVVTKNTKMMILCNPHNPTGRVWDREELRKLEEFCTKYDLLLFSDEIHSDILAADKIFYSVLENRDNHNLIVASSLTKTFNIPGIMVSYMIIPNQGLRDKVCTAIQRIELESANIFAISALEAGYGEGEWWYQEMLLYINENDKYTRAFFKVHMSEFKILPREGTFLLWVDYQALQCSESELTEWFASVGVSVILGSTFGTSGEGYFRINIAAPRALLKMAYERMVSGYSHIGT